MATIPETSENEPPPDTPPQESDLLAPLKRLSGDANKIIANLVNQYAGHCSREQELLQDRPRMTRVVKGFRERNRVEHLQRYRKIAVRYLERELSECLEVILMSVESRLREAIAYEAPVVMRSAGLSAEMCQRVQALTNAHLAEVCAAGQVTKMTEDVPQGSEAGQPETEVEPSEQVSVTTS